MILFQTKRAARAMFLAAALAFSFAPGQAAAADRPNIIFLLTDDMGYGDCACYGGKFVPTPNIDRLAAEGTKFTQFYAGAPLCSASRTAFTTGMFPGRWHITSYLQTRAGNRKCEQADFLDPYAPSIARTLKDAGYVTGHFGKWHMGGGRDVTNAPPFGDYGFDEHSSTWESPDPDPNITGTNWIWSKYDKVKRWDRSAYFVDKTLDFLRRHKGQPCYVNLWPDDVHTPWVPEGSDLERKRQARDDNPANFKAVLREYDKQVGRLMAGLKELGLDDNTIVIFSSDNGPLPSFQGKRSGGLRGSKDSLYEGGTRMPMIVRWPGHVPAGRVDDTTIMHAVDFFPMFCKLAGADLPANAAFDGENLLASFFGQSMARHKPLFWEYGRNTNGFDFPRIARDRSPNVSVREGKWKLLVNADGSGLELYDLNADRDESKNIAAENSEVAQRLKAEALAWRKSLP
ncbi:MAG TPA: sulfatase-like hydrolase/transferase [Verrucomicrobiae bacterium]|jgi:arylsulfatase A-like enzyme